MQQIPFAIGPRLKVWLVHQQIAGLAVEERTDSLKRRKPNTFDVAGADERDILLRDADVLRQFPGGFLAPGEHDIELYYDGHGLHDLLVLLGEPLTLLHNPSNNQQHESEKDRRQLRIARCE